MEQPPRRTASERYSKTYWLSVITLIAIFVVNLLGFTDTVTGSAMGCGRNWPLCNGEMIPSAWNMGTFIEFTHRISVLVGGLLLIVSAIATWRKHGQDRSVRLLVALSLFGVLLEGALGALAVLFVNPPVVMAGHMGIALISFASVFLVTVIVRQKERPRVLPVVTKDVMAQREWRAFSRCVWWSIPYAYAAIYVGAYVASTGYGSSFQGWPLPIETYAQVGPAFFVDILHRLVAFGYLLFMVQLVWLAYRFRSTRPQLFGTSCVALALVCLQAVSGGLLIATHLSVYAFLFHVTNVSVLFAVQCYLGLQVLQESSVFAHRPQTLVARPAGRARTGARRN